VVETYFDTVVPDFEWSAQVPHRVEL